MRKIASRAGGCLMAMVSAALFPGGPAWAGQGQDAPAEQGKSAAANDGDIIVTATRFGQTRLHDTAAAISVFSQDYMANMMVSDTRDLAMVTPGLTLSANSNMAQIYIRGVGSNNVFAGSDPSSTIHYDGVYLARPQSNFANFVDVERVEVLRGPQGTLYGRNSVGGTINIVSRRPSVSESRGEATISYGNDDFHRIDAYATTPLVTGAVGLSLAGQYSRRDPVRKNIAPGGNDVDDEDTRSLRGQLLWQISGSIEAILRADWNEDDSTLYSGSSSPLTIPAGNPPLASSVVGKPRRVAMNAPSYVDRQAYGFGLEVNTDLTDTLKLKSLTAWRSNDNFIASDPDTTERDTVRTLLWEDQEQVSQEFNLIGNFGKARLFLGAFYFREDVSSVIEVQARATGNSTKYSPFLVTDSWSLFGQFEYDVIPQLTVTLGGRYTEETKDWRKSFGSYRTDTGIPVNVTQMAPERQKSNEFTPKIGLQYRPNDDLLLYATASRGFKSGGFNITASLPGGYQPEYLWAYEAGLNARLGGRFTSRLSVFHYDYKDLQVQAFIVPGVASITNAASATIDGAEAEFALSVTDSFSIRGNAAYLDARYEDYPVAPVGGGVVIDASGKRLNNAPKFSISGTADYKRSFDWGSLHLSAEYGWKSKIYFSVANTDLLSQPGYGILNASIGVENPDESLGLTLWARNATDEVYLTSAGTISTPAGRYGPVRSYGVRLVARF